LKSLYSEIFQSFREIGNCFLILKKLELIVGMEGIAFLRKEDQKTELDLISPFLKALQTKTFKANDETLPDESLLLSQSNAFCKLSNFLQFLYCLPCSRLIENKRGYDLFGDSFIWAVQLLNLLFQQDHYVKATSLNVHLLAVYREEEQDKKVVLREDVTEFLQQAQRMENTIQHISAELQDNLLNNE
jgi:hypothetical protein